MHNYTLQYIKCGGVRLALHAWIPRDVKAVLFYIHGKQSHAGMVV